MASVSAEKRSELEGFWRSHHEGWKSSPLNRVQRACALLAAAAVRRKLHQRQQSGPASQYCWRARTGLPVDFHYIRASLRGQRSEYIPGEEKRPDTKMMT